MRAHGERRVLPTFDKDFGELVFRRRAVATEGVVLFRLPRGGPTTVAAWIERVLGSRSDWAGRFTIVEPTRIRMRDMP